MMGAAPILEIIRLDLPDRQGPYAWSPPALAEPGVRLLRLIHNGVTQPRKRRDVQSVQEGAFTYRIVGGTEIRWACYEWLAPKTHKLKIEVDRSAQAGRRLLQWLKANPGCLEGGDALQAAAEGCDDRWVRKLVEDPGFVTSFDLVRLLVVR